MSKRAIDVDKAIAQVRAIPSLAPVAAWAELGRAVAAAIRAAGGLPRVRKARVRKARVKVEGKARPAQPKPHPLGTLQSPLTGLGGTT